MTSLQNLIGIYQAMDKTNAKAQLKILLERYDQLKNEKDADIKSKAEEKTKNKQALQSLKTAYQK